jgi:hypothetical protein
MMSQVGRGQDMRDSISRRKIPNVISTIEFSFGIEETATSIGIENRFFNGSVALCFIANDIAGKYPKGVQDALYRKGLVDVFVANESDLMFGDMMRVQSNFRTNVIACSHSQESFIGTVAMLMFGYGYFELREIFEDRISEVQNEMDLNEVVG